MLSPTKGGILSTLGTLQMNREPQIAVERFFSSVNDVVFMLEIYQAVNGIAMLLMVPQLVSKLNFHPQMGLISRTLDAAAFHLVFFIVLFICISIIFTVLGFTLFGQACAFEEQMRFPFLMSLRRRPRGLLTSRAIFVLLRR